MNIRFGGVFLFLLLASGPIYAQYLITPSNKCYKQIQEGVSLNDEGAYEDAIIVFQEVLKKCSAKDAKQEGNVGLAIASNGLQDYESAISYANTAIKISKNKNVMAFYARNVAYQNLGKIENAREDLLTINSLTTKNKNTKARASMFAQLAHLDFQLNRFAEADSNLLKAIELDPSNSSFFIQQGDMKVKQANYTDAFKAYDKVLELGKKDLEIYQIRTEARLKQMQEKYNTTDTKRLAQQMTITERTLLCNEIKNSVNVGLRNMQVELLGTLICD